MFLYTVTDGYHGHHREVEAVAVLGEPVGDIKIFELDPVPFCELEAFFYSRNENPEAGKNMADQEDCHEEFDNLQDISQHKRKGLSR